MERGLFYKLKINIIYIGVRKENFLFRYTLQRIICKFLTGIISLYITEFCAAVFVVFHCCAQIAVFACGLDIIAEKFFLCHNKSSFPNNYKLFFIIISYNLKKFYPFFKFFSLFCIKIIHMISKNSVAPLLVLKLKIYD